MSIDLVNNVTKGFSQLLPCQVADKAAADKVRAALERPVLDEFGDAYFDPWEDVLPVVYGTYCSDFDDLAIDVLQELVDGEVRRDDLAARMFRELLCRASLCDYGTSPRVCFPTGYFRTLVPDLLAKWKEFSRENWGRGEA